MDWNKGFAVPRKDAMGFAFATVWTPRKQSDLSGAKHCVACYSEPREKQFRKTGQANAIEWLAMHPFKALRKAVGPQTIPIHLDQTTSAMPSAARFLFALHRSKESFCQDPNEGRCHSSCPRSSGGVHEGSESKYIFGCEAWLDRFKHCECDEEQPASSRVGSDEA